jgi:hypothetical protein
MTPVKNFLFALAVGAVINSISAVRINSISFDGAGCPANTVGVLVNQAGDIANLIFDAFLVDATLGPDQTINSSCGIKLELGSENPANSTLHTDIRGFAAVYNGVFGTLSANPSSSVELRPLDPPQTIDFANSAADYSTVARTSIVHLSTTPQNLVFTTDLELTSCSGNGTGLLVVDSIILSLQA